MLYNLNTIINIEIIMSTLIDFILNCFLLKLLLLLIITNQFSYVIYRTFISSLKLFCSRVTHPILIIYSALFAAFRGASRSLLCSQARPLVLCRPGFLRHRCLCVWCHIINGTCCITTG